MKNVLKIAIVPCCLARLCHGDISATEKMDTFSRSSIPQNKLYLHENFKNEPALANTIEFDKITKGFDQNTAKFRKKSKTKGKPVTKSTNSSSDKFGWYTDNNRISLKYVEAKQIGKYGNGGLYVYMDPSFMNSQWKDAFDKGLAERAKGQNGIKVLDNLIELKINADARLYTTKLHKNDQGDYIAILDNEARHKEIHRKNNKNKLKIKECYSSASK